MMKKIIWSLVIILVIGIIGWFDLPYIKSTKNLISNQKTDYTYERISFDTWSEEYSPPIEIRDEAHMKNIISKIDALKLRRTRNISFSGNTLNFFGRFTNDKNETLVDDLYSISFSRANGSNILIFSKKDEYKAYFYKILDKNFDIEAFLKELQGEDI